LRLCIPQRDWLFVAQQEVHALLDQLPQPEPGKVAQVANPQAAWGHLLLTQGTLPFVVASLLHIRTTQPAFEQIPPHRQFEGRLRPTAATATPHLLERSRQGDGAAIFYQHGRKTLQQWNGHRLRTHQELHPAPQYR